MTGTRLGARLTTLLLATLPLAALLGACTGRGEPGEGAPSAALAPPAAEAAVRALLDEQRVAWNRGDLDGFMEGYWRSDSLTFYSGGDVNHGWQATYDRYVRRYRSEGREMGTLEFDLHRVDVLGSDHALVRGAWRLTRKADAPHGLFTLVLRRLPGGWKIVHDHTGAAE